MVGGSTKQKRINKVIEVTCICIIGGIFGGMQKIIYPKIEMIKNIYIIYSSPRWPNFRVGLF